jgi:Zn finger protein HypA/HybF involved in hydrogenase expression
MGTIYQIFCEGCGYNRGDVIEGFGMSGMGFNYVIAPCMKCGVIKEINIATDNLVCKRCKTTLIPFDLNKTQNDCPKCKKPSLNIWFCGLWD